MHSWHAMLHILYVMDSLFFATPKSKRVLLLAWRHTLLTPRRTDSLFFATPKSKRFFLMHSRHVTFALCLGVFFFATPKSKRVLMHAWRYLFLALRFAVSLYSSSPMCWRVCLMLACLPCVCVWCPCTHVSCYLFVLPSPLCALCALLTRTSRLAPMARTWLGCLEHALFNFFVFAARLLLVFASFHLPCCCSLHKSLAPRTRTLLGVLGQATLNFVAVATLLFFCFCVCPNFCDLAKQRRKMFVGVSEVGKIDFALYFFWLCVFFLVL